MPDIDSSRYSRSSGSKQKSGGSKGIGAILGNSMANQYKTNNAQWLNQLQGLLFQPSGGGGGMPRQYVGSGGGGGGYDPFSFERQRLAELDKRKKILTGYLQNAKNAALPLISGYTHDYGVNVGKLYKQNQAVTGDYTRQLRSLGNQMRSGANSELAGLKRDLGAQGGGGADMRALQAAAMQNVQGQQFLTNNADAYNRRLAQVMQNAGTDAKAMGSAIGASGKSQLENSYLQALMQIQLMGLV